MTEQEPSGANPEEILNMLDTNFHTEWIDGGSELFEGVTLDEFEAQHYSRFLDNISSLENLISGLEYYNPLFEEALSTAKQMTSEDFNTFKEQLAHERSITKKYEEVSQLEDKYLPILFPDNFLDAHFIAEKFEVSWGLALYKLKAMELERKINRAT